MQVPEAAVVIDGHDRYLMPGLADMHAHIMDEDQLLLFVANGVTTVRNMSGGGRAPERGDSRKEHRSGEIRDPSSESCYSFHYQPP